MQQAFISLLQSIGIFDIDPKDYTAITVPLKEGEQAIRPMNDLEKTCYTFLAKAANEHEDMHDKMDSLSNDTDEYKELHKRHNLMHNVTDMIKGAMWTSVMSQSSLPEDLPGLFFRENFVIAVGPSENLLCPPAFTDPHALLSAAREGLRRMAHDHQKK